MSSTRGGLDPSDLYVTPAWAVDAILPHLPVTGVVVDAGCGDGAILGRIAQLHDVGSGALMFLGCDTHQGRVAAGVARMGSLALQTNWRVEVSDWLGPKPPGFSADLVVMNPPFSLAEEFILRAREVTAPRHGTVAALLRWNWPVPECRADFVKHHPFDAGWLSKRPEFVASLKCHAKCGWKVMQRLDAERPRVCPSCGAKVTVVTSDSADYGWFIFGPGRDGAMFPLDIPAEARGRRAKEAA